MQWKDKHVLITGLSGFVGSYLGEYLVDQGAKIFGLVRPRSDGEVPRNIRSHQLDGRAKLLTGDLLDPTRLGDVLDESQPEVIFHLAAQSFVPRSFQYPAETYLANLVGTLNLLEALRLRKLAPTFVFAGSSEEYGLVFASENQYETFVKTHGSVSSPPVSMPELPIKESNPLRPMSPYGVTKLQAEYMILNYALTYGLPAIVSRAFNHEGAGRGTMFVTTVIAGQVANLVKGVGERKLVIGNVNAFRDWSHVKDIVRGYCLLAEQGTRGEIYNQGSRRTNSILSYILLALQEVGINVEKIESFKNGKTVLDPLQTDREPIWGCVFDKIKVDSLMLHGELSFELADEGIWLHTDAGKIPVYFDAERYRPLEVPILLGDTTKIDQLGFQIRHSVGDIVRDQINHYLIGNSAANTLAVLGRPSN